jgi:hypothetical protein
MPSFFGYEEVIKRKMVEMGWNVHFCSDRPSESSFVKAAIRINYRIISGRVKAYYDSILDKYEDGYFDKVMLVRGEAVSLDWLESAKKKNPKAEFILYFWDAIAYNKNAINIYTEFDRVLSFDFDDCEKYDFFYRPLFAPDVYFNQKNAKKIYDIVFIGTVYSDRHCVIQEILDICERQNYSIFLHAYYPSKFFAILRCLFDWRFCNFYLKHVTHEKLSQTETANIISKSKVVVDVNRESQKGLTMRTIEAMAANTKLITTNAALCEEAEYDKSIHLVINRDEPVFDDEFVGSSFVKPERLDKYTVEAWVFEVLGEAKA